MNSKANTKVWAEQDAQPEQLPHRLDGAKDQPLDDDIELVGDLGNAADGGDAREEMWSEIRHMTATPEMWRRFGPVLRALDRQRYVLAAARIRAQRIAAIESALTMKKKSEAKRPAEPSWQDLWDAAERDAELPKKGYEPDVSDPATPEANPEIADWEAHWPADATDVPRVETQAPLDPRSTEPRIVIVIRGIKKLMLRK
jgi:hypothetical protein